jgi:hypothetical protein
MGSRDFPWLSLVMIGACTQVALPASPGFTSLILTHISQCEMVKPPGKRSLFATDREQVESLCGIRPLERWLSTSLCEMWVKDRLYKPGFMT